MSIRQVTDDVGWKKLLAYYADGLRKEEHAPDTIKPQNYWFLPHLDGSFLRNAASFAISIRRNHEPEVERLRRFVLGESKNQKQPHVCFGYPFFVDSEGNLTPIFYVEVSGQQAEKGVRLTSSSARVEINQTALDEILSGDADGEAVDWDALEAESGRTRFDRTLDLFSSHLEKRFGKPLARVSGEHFDPAQLPPRAIVECPLLFHGRTAGAGRARAELAQLQAQHDWDALQPALRHLLAGSSDEAYPQTSRDDPPPYIVPANDSQRKAIAAAGQCPLTVVASPPGIDRPQFITNLVGDAVLKGETVLVASPGSETADVVFGRLSNEFNYPGVVRTGQGIPAPMLATMRRALAGARARDAEKTETRQREMADALDALPESIRAFVQDDGIRFGPGDEDDGQRLDAAIDALWEEVQEIVLQRQTLAEEVHAMLLDSPSANPEDVALLVELEEAEQHLGVSADLDSFRAIDTYLSAWDNLLQVIPLESDVRQWRARLSDAQRHAQSQRQDLPAGLAAALDGVAETFDEQRERALRQGLEEIESQAQAAAQDYGRLVKQVGALRKRSKLAAQWLLAATAMRDDDSAALRLEDILDRGFVIKDDVLEAHRLSAAQVDLAERSQRLQHDCDVNIAALESSMTRLDKEFTAVRALMPDSLRPRIEAAVEVSDHKGWRDLAEQLAKLDLWASRVEMGRLTLGERLRKVGSRQWEIKHLRAEFKALRKSSAALLALSPATEPSAAASFKAWAEYVRAWNSFAQVCALAARRADVQRALASCRSQGEDESNARFIEAQEAETRLAELVARLPGTVAGAMADGSWPPGPFDDAAARALDELEEQYRHLKTQYTSWTERLAALRQGQVLPQVLQGPLGAFLSDGHGQGTKRPIPLLVLDMVSTWLQWARASEAEYELARSRSGLAKVEDLPDALWARLPDGLCDELDWSQIGNSEELVRSLRQFVSNLRPEIVSQIEEWKQIRERATALLHHNELEIPALGLALEKAQDPDYLAGLLGKTHRLDEQLLDDLHTWQQVVRVWRLRGQQTDSRRQAVRGDTRLVEQWRRVADGLEPDTVQSIEHYLSKAGRAETHYDAVLKLFPVWLTAGLATHGIPLQAGLFDCVVIDGASQCDLSSALPVLFRGKRIVVVGDQRPPATEDDELYSLFDLAADSVAKGPGQISLEQEHRNED